MKVWRGLSTSRRVILVIATAFALAASSGFAIMFFGNVRGTYDTGMIVVLLGLGAAGLVLSGWLDIIPLFAPGTPRSAANGMYVQALMAIALAGIATVVGELLLVAALLLGDLHPGRNGVDPLTVGLLLGSVVAVCGVLAGWLVIWPAVALVRIAFNRGHAHDNPTAVAVPLLLLTVIATVVIESLVVKIPSDVTGRGAGPYMAVAVFLQYGGNFKKQVWLWIARLLEVAIVLELVWLVRIGRRRKRSSN